MMDLITGYKTAKQNTALLKIFSEGFPETQKYRKGLKICLTKMKAQFQGS